MIDIEKQIEHFHLRNEKYHFPRKPLSKLISTSHLSRKIFCIEISVHLVQISWLKAKQI